MIGRLYVICIVLLFNQNVQAKKEKNVWHIAKPYQNNPLKTATIMGRGEIDKYHGGASLTLSCRGDAPPARVSFAVDGMLSTHFPTVIFEGPGATGEKVKLLSVRLGGEALQYAWYTYGSFQLDNNFEWVFAPFGAELKSWLNASGKPLTVYVTVPGNSKLLKAFFFLPDDATLLRAVLAPCVGEISQ